MSKEIQSVIIYRIPISHIFTLLTQFNPKKIKKIKIKKNDNF